MGSSVSSYAFNTFEIINECFISVSAGLFGLFILADYGIKNSNVIKTTLMSIITVGSLFYFFQCPQEEDPSPNKVIFITGCDSGLGFSLAQHACESGFTVWAGCLRLDSKGAMELRKFFGKKIHHIEIDITRTTSIEVAVDVIERFFKSNPNYRLWAVVNNAGIMVFGEFEWLTDELIQDQLNINLLGTLRVTKAFCPMLRHHKGRIIIISSHCALATLPGLSVYGATKAGLLGWCDGLRVELKKYGVDVISFIPGSFAQQSNIMACQIENFYEMHSSFTNEQREFYDDYFKRYNLYLGAISGRKEVKKIDDPGLYRKFEEALLDIHPKSVYMHEPFKYSIYHILFKYAPVPVRDYLVVKFMQMPEYTPKTSQVIEIA